MYRLAVDALPEGGAFVVGEGVEEGFSEGGVGVEGVERVLGARRVGTSAVVMAVVAVRARGMVRGGGGRTGSWSWVFGFEAERFGRGMGGRWRGGWRSHC